MNISKKEGKNGEIAILYLDQNQIADVASAMDFIISASYDSGCTRIVMNKEGLIDDFFILSKLLLGEFLQKCKNYNIKLAIYGDYLNYTSKPLKDFIYESNNGSDFYFVASEEEAIERLGGGY